ncbi:cupin domain-containing protein [Pedobacter sp. Leaf250]|uniref:cupin domain-containing protein n=1 Tax=Pedobacter sp. Leaf250 TaxID=2876559 RepID=UPI0010DB4E73|nr:cupin domain-containing protein [Pedobacter sp. Leaf250]RYD75652.1 MAG: cupin domain-containing protein [Sphingobacteriales bacterium]
MENLEDNGFTPAPSAYFTGNAFLKILVAADETTNCNISEVAFEKGCRNNWHTHPSNQILIVKEGVCLYQEEGKPIQHFKVGEAINILPGIKHWHGASPEEPMIHFAINTNTEKGMVNWQEPVTDEQYHQQ